MLPSIIVVMGVSGSGKTTVATDLAARLGWPLAEGDRFHSEANVAKMRAGIPLTDEDRWPWLRAIARWIDEERSAGRHGIVACSALKRSYRDIVIGARSDVRLVYLKGAFDLIAQRIAKRRHHYMPVSLLQSQFDALEEPAPDENAVVVSIRGAPQEIVAAILGALQLPAD